MEQANASLNELLNSIIDDSILAITVDNQLAKQGIILLTVYPENGHPIDDKLTGINTSLIDGFPAQIEFEQSWFGVSSYERTLLYLRENSSTPFRDGPEIARKSLQEGLKDFRKQFLGFSDGDIHDSKRPALDAPEDNAGETVLREYAGLQLPDDVFAQHYGELVIEIYTVSRHEYAFKLNRTVYEEAKSGSRVSIEDDSSITSEITSEQLRDSDFWQRNPPHDS